MGVTDTVVRAAADYGAWLHEWYTPKIYKARNIQNVFMDDRIILFDHEHIAGNYALVPVEFQSLAGIGARAENTLNPTPDAGEYDDCKMQLKTNIAVMQLSIQLMKTSEGDKAAYAPATVRTTETVMTAWLRDLNRQVLGDGEARLAQADASGGTTFTVDAAWGIENTSAGSNANGDLFVSENLRVSFFVLDSNNGAIRASGGTNPSANEEIITAFTRGYGSTEATISIADYSSIVDGDYMVRYGNRTTASKGSNEMMGLMGFLADSTEISNLYLNDDDFENISTTTRPDWAPKVFRGSSAGTVEPLTRVRMNEAWKHVVKVGGGKVDFLFCGTDTEETYLELADSMQLATNLVKLDAAPNWEGPSFRGAPIISDPIYPETRIEFIDSSVLAIYEEGPADWIPGDVGVLQKISGYMNYKAEFMWMANFGIRDRSKIASLHDIELVTA